MLVVKVLYLWVKTFKLAFEIKKGASYGKKDLCGIIKSGKVILLKNLPGGNIKIIFCLTLTV